MSILVGGFVTVAYTLVGGMLAITITDLIQFVLMTIGIAILIPGSTAGGMVAISAAVPPEFFTLTNINSGTRPLGLFMSLYLGSRSARYLVAAFSPHAMSAWRRSARSRRGLFDRLGRRWACGILAGVLLPAWSSAGRASRAGGEGDARRIERHRSGGADVCIDVHRELHHPGLRDPGDQRPAQTGAGFRRGAELAVSRWVTAV